MRSGSLPEPGSKYVILHAGEDRLIICPEKGGPCFQVVPVIAVEGSARDAQVVAEHAAAGLQYIELSRGDAMDAAMHADAEAELSDLLDGW